MEQKTTVKVTGLLVYIMFLKSLIQKPAYLSVRTRFECDRGTCRVVCVFARAIFEVRRRIQETNFCLIRQCTHTPGCNKGLRYQLVVWCWRQRLSKASCSHDTDNSLCYWAKTTMAYTHAHKHLFIFRTGRFTTGEGSDQTVTPCGEAPRELCRREREREKKSMYGH